MSETTRNRLVRLAARKLWENIEPTDADLAESISDACRREPAMADYWAVLVEGRGTGISRLYNDILKKWRESHPMPDRMVKR